MMENAAHRMTNKEISNIESMTKVTRPETGDILFSPLFRYSWFFGAGSAFSRSAIQASVRHLPSSILRSL
jgi:hypothetical protein